MLSSDLSLSTPFGGLKRRRENARAGNEGATSSSDDDDGALEFALLADANTIPSRVLLAVMDCHSGYLLAADLIPVEETKSAEARQSLCRSKAESSMTALLKSVASGNGSWSREYCARAAALPGLPDYSWVPQHAVPAACTSAFFRLTTSLRGRMGAIVGSQGQGSVPTREWYQQMASILSSLASAWNSTPYSMLRVGGDASLQVSQGQHQHQLSTLSPFNGGFASSPSPALVSPAAASSSTSSSSPSVDWSRVKHLITGGFGLGASARVASSSGPAAASAPASAAMTPLSPTHTHTNSHAAWPASLMSPTADSSSKRSRATEAAIDADADEGSSGSNSKAMAMTNGERSLFAFAVDASGRTMPLPPQEATPTETFVHSLLSTQEARQSLVGRPILGTNAGTATTTTTSNGSVAILRSPTASLYGDQQQQSLGFGFGSSSAFFSPKPTLMHAAETTMTMPASMQPPPPAAGADWSALMTHMTASARNAHGGGAVSAPPFPFPSPSPFDGSGSSSGSNTASLSIFPSAPSSAAMSLADNSASSNINNPFRKSLSYHHFSAGAAGSYATSAPVSPAAGHGYLNLGLGSGSGRPPHTNPFFASLATSISPAASEVTVASSASSSSSSSATATPAGSGHLQLLRHAASSSALFAGGHQYQHQQQHPHHQPHAPIFTAHHTATYHSLLLPAPAPPPAFGSSSAAPAPEATTNTTMGSSGMDEL